MYSRTVFLLYLFCFSHMVSQEIHPLEAPKGHYETFMALDDGPNPSNSRLDEITFPMSEANSGYKIYVGATPVYLTDNQVENLKSSMEYPANSSVQTRAELNFLLEWQAKRTKEQVKRVADFLAPIGYWPHIDENKGHSGYEKNLQHLFYEGRTVLGENCNEENYPNTSKLLKGITKDMRIMEFTVKYHLLRARPYHLEPKLEPLAQMGSPAFASGHTLWAYIHAFTWSELVPQKREEFLKTAYEVGESREIMGIHYPSDEEAARVLAYQMLVAMMENDSFKNDLYLAKAEWD
ncbi:phosphatase PAP2 family protein [Croceitalea rosinachiae]|uniref:Phosphatase PAP2 family protein n=1 Tax=Croceitalea rosinachiae TaxID=3075596 RepID=A0ABU3AC65_9FLAO|nr:phosphatase PAP2 family protein [Croceitalea sp. F388]MDT0607779.1 phosphatase PAP2 family protein [Croceitalea sp. F388]